ncbi:hypothetical protein GDO86_016444 [Hymenochirus boettgeri]|uniref:Olfactory receptor n=1 Tax=Hymenochirus boettgeri TaxID=247094 RepID=A0A8T2K229_9PIPI|nr:hypothetical protein GDO86_016444 [Hymenochirus boettgeri]
MAFSDFHQIQYILFITILLMYLTCLIGNITVIFLVKTETSLHSPMYFFISLFAALEIVFVSVTVPNLLANLITGNKSISFTGCFAQLYAFSALGETECCLLAIMAFDRHLAINSPLHYTIIMNHTFCLLLASLPWIVGFIISFIPTIFTAWLEFCGPNEINHFFCDFAPLQNLACSDPFISNVVTSLAAIVTVVIPFVIIAGFYIQIIVTVISKMNSSESKHKAFSTCSSHLIVSSLFYGTAMIVYIRPKANHYDKFLALTYTVLIPLVNPFVYTLRNRIVKDSLGKSLRCFVRNFHYNFL